MTTLTRPHPAAAAPAPAPPAATKVTNDMAMANPMPTPWRLDLLADDGDTTDVNVPDATDPAGWDTAEAIVTSALTGKTFHAAGRVLRGTGRPLDVIE